MFLTLFCNFIFFSHREKILPCNPYLASNSRCYCLGLLSCEITSIHHFSVFHPAQICQTHLLQSHSFIHSCVNFPIQTNFFFTAVLRAVACLPLAAVLDRVAPSVFSRLLLMVHSIWWARAGSVLRNTSLEALYSNANCSC